MKILITTGNTQTPIDRVRCLTNIFSGRTGAVIAMSAWFRQHDVTFVTSQPGLVNKAIRSIAYRTYDDLESVMADEIQNGKYDCLIMAAAVNDYHVAGSYGLDDGTTFEEESLSVNGPFKDVARGKVKGNHRELWLRLQPLPKLIDRVRRDWGFTGTLVKFKLEVDVDDEELLRIAEESRRQSQAEWIVANSFQETVGDAWILGEHSPAVKVTRDQLPGALLDRLAKPTS